VKNLILGPAFPYRGGIANFDEALCEAFNKQGTTSEIVSFIKQYPDFLFPGTSQFDYDRKAPSIIVNSKIHAYNPFLWFSAAHFIINKKPDYIVVRFWLPLMGPALGSILRLVKRKLKVPVIAITDNIVPHEKRKGDKIFTKYFVNSCDGFVTMSHAVLDDLTVFTSNPNKIFHPHPLYHIFGDPIPQQEAIKNLHLNNQFKYLLFFGFIRNYKGLDLILEAMKEIKTQFPFIKLIVAGEYYEDSTPYLEIIKQHQLEDQVIMHTHYIADEMIKNYFSACSLVVQPYKSATQSGVTQIAYHFNKPMVVTKVGGLAEIVPHEICGYVVEPKAVEISKAVIRYFIENKEEEMTQNCKNEKKRFQWSSMVSAVENLASKLK
jgi:D-inositol-3-phosphate glycosyltransferase